ncbi:MAG: hypothetical protein GVY17_07705 [Cyanobacteria bacterium]|jgi:hypothetical protein|nr:hypothetical protein [Cyanobacteria bacterium GSL.Bin21]
MNGRGTKIQSHTALSENTLSLEEQQERLHLERKVERAFYEAGKSLAQLRDRKLYRNTHASFEEYCRERFSFQPRHCYQLIDAARVVDHLIESLNFDERCAPLAHILPTKERQVRPLTALPSEEQKEAWVSAIAAAGGKIPNSRQVTEAVQIIKDRLSQSQLTSNPHYLGEICQVRAKENPELRELIGYFGIINAVHDYSCTVKTYKGESLISNRHLESMNYTSSETEQAQQLLQRLWKIREVEHLDGAATHLLNYLEKQHSPSLTPLQEALVETLESHYLE